MTYSDEGFILQYQYEGNNCYEIHNGVRVGKGTFTVSAGVCNWIMTHHRENDTSNWIEFDTPVSGSFGYTISENGNKLLDDKGRTLVKNNK
ncbi:MAG: hypothetical protein LBE14_02620 [Treponema sp.]|jgi:hypothetical protein|nr:hypothetical protein [Treponema sp.]